MADMAVSRAILVSAGLLLDSSRHILLQKRPAGRAHSGLWEFPGGKVEAGESAADCLARELHEELGIGVDPAELVPVTFSKTWHQAGSLWLLLFHVPRWQGTPSALHADQIAFFQPCVLQTLAMPPADVPLIPAALRLATSQSGKSG